MPEISSLTVSAVVTGSVLLVFFLAWLCFPQATNGRLAAFPRNRLPGIALTAVDITLIAYLLLSEGFSWIEAYRPLVFVAAPAAFAIVVIFMDELLSVRALGGLFLLIPFWILKTAFMHPSSARLLMTSFAYLVAAAGMALIWSPYLFGRIVKRARAGGPAGYIIGFSGAALGTAMIILGFFAY